MRKQVYEIDVNGFLREIYVANVDESNNILDEDKIEFISVDPPNGLYKPKWTGTGWVEGATPEEIAEITKIEPQPPTDKERITELENIILTLLMEV